MKIQRRYAGLVSGLMISVSLSISISLILTLMAKTSWDVFLESWLMSSARGLSIGYPLGRIFVPISLGLVEKIVEDE